MMRMVIHIILRMMIHVNFKAITIAYEHILRKLKSTKQWHDKLGLGSAAAGAASEEKELVLVFIYTTKEE
jgi:hypothetical protein